ncbi:HIT family protein [Nitrosomonas sp.]|uniref:HIT family protein n=1 Tax=Nitrosomonas sp. TaxID=42353 RepID=UPI0025E6EAEA|nr:HIT family protein [Nitrosomonas sp.]MCC6915918.1 HIT family protein [Nitrosomonas sp.]
MSVEIFNGTMQKFGAPDTVICQFKYWSVLLRPAQLTLGALVLVAHEPVQSFSALSSVSFAELQIVTGKVDSALKKTFQYDKLNYLMLMMVDPDVHFHVIPRYAQAREFAGKVFYDAGWPGVPDFSKINETGKEMNQQIISQLISCREFSRETGCHGG